MADLEVDIATRADGERVLEAVTAEFDGSEDRRDDLSDIVGQSSVRRTMHEFASNMHDNRRRRCEEIQTAGEKLSGTREAWR